MTFDDNHSLATAAKELRDQWEMIRSRLDALDSEVLTSASSLAGWTVNDLLARIGRTLESISETERVHATEPVTLADYLSAQVSSTDLEQGTREYTALSAADPLGTLDASAEAAFNQLTHLLEAGPESLVRTPSAVLEIGSCIAVALIELVLRGYDLAPALAAPAPVDPGARELVATVLIEVANHRSSYALTVADATTWIKAASGRGTWAEVVARSAVQPEYLSDGLPDLGQFLPLV